MTSIERERMSDADGRDEKMNIREPKNMKAGEKGNLSAGGRGRKGGRDETWVWAD